MQRFHYDHNADAVYDTSIATGVRILALDAVSEHLSPTEVDAAIDLMNARDGVLTFDELYPLLQVDEQSFCQAEAAALTGAPTHYSRFRIIRDGKCEIRVIVGDTLIPEDARVLVRWAFEGERWVDYDA